MYDSLGAFKRTKNSVPAVSSSSTGIAPMDNLMVATVSALLGAAGHNVASIGDIEIAAGVTLEVADGAMWSILT